MIDDNPSIHEDVRKILCPPVSDAGANLDALEAELFGSPGETVAAPKRVTPSFTVDSAHQGQDGLALVKAAVAAGKPYGMAFVDMRMPPGLGWRRNHAGDLEGRPRPADCDLHRLLGLFLG